MPENIHNDTSEEGFGLTHNSEEGEAVGETSDGRNTEAPNAGLRERAKNKAVKVEKKAELYDVRTEDLQDDEGSVRYSASIDAPGKDKTYKRTVRFIVPKATREAFLASRKNENVTFTGESLVDQYGHYRKSYRIPEGKEGKDWNRAAWLSNDEFRSQLPDWGYEAGENTWERPVAESVEQEIANMLRENNYDLMPKAVAFESSLKNKGGQIVFNVDQRKFITPLEEVKDRVEVVLGLLAEGALPVLEKYRNMDINEVKKLPDTERPLALQILGTFAGLPTKALKIAQTWVDNGKAQELLEGYVQAKMEDRGADKKRRKTPKDRHNEDLTFVFENLGLRLRDGNYSFTTQAAQDALIERLTRKPKGQESKGPDILSEAKEFISGLDLKKLGFSGLQKKIAKLGVEGRALEAIYLATCLDLERDPNYIVKDLDKKNLFVPNGEISFLQVFQTAARVAIEQEQKRAKGHEVIEYADKKHFDETKDVTFKDPEEPRPDTFVAMRREQKGTGRQFVDVAINRQPQKGETPKPDRVFHIPFKDNSVVDSLENAKDLQRRVAYILSERHSKHGQRLSFSPHVELLKSKTNNNPKFRLSLGNSQTEVDYQMLFESLSFRNKVEAELLRANYLDSKKGGDKAWQKMRPFQKEAVYSFQNMILHSGLPSLTEQLIVQELKNQFAVKKETAAPVLNRKREVVKVPAKKAAVKEAVVVIKPMGNISPKQLTKPESAAKEKPKPPAKKVAEAKLKQKKKK